MQSRRGHDLLVRLRSSTGQSARLLSGWLRVQISPGAPSLQKRCTAVGAVIVFDRFRLNGLTALFHGSVHDSRSDSLVA
jgi:hypothetical protein